MNDNDDGGEGGGDGEVGGERQTDRKRWGGRERNDLVLINSASDPGVHVDLFIHPVCSLTTT